MKPISASRLGLLLLAAAALLLPLNALDSPRPPPHGLSFAAALRLFVGLPVLLFVPSFFLAPLLFRTDLFCGRSEADGADPSWWALSAAGLALVVHFVNFNLLRLCGLEINSLSLNLLLLMEGLLCFALLRRRHPGLRVGAERRSTRAALWIAALGSLAFAIWQHPHLLQDSSWYFDDESLNQGLEPSHHPGAIRYHLRGGQRLEQARAFTPSGQVETVIVSNEADGPQLVPLYFLVHSQVGASAQLVVHHSSAKTPGISPPSAFGAMSTIEQAGRWGDHLVERYWKWGALVLSQQVEVPARGSTAVDLRLIPPAHGGTEFVAAEFQVIVLANLTGAEVRGELQELGIHSMHPFQMLNVTENVRWAAEVASTHILPGHSPPWVQPASTLHQPPAWTYLYAPARELLTEQLVSASALLVLILLAIVVTGIKGLEGSPGMSDLRVALALATVLSLGAAQHGRLMVSDGSMNFPDSLFACALLIAVVSLVAGRLQIFVLWAMLAALLRYPGAVVVLLAGLSLLAVDRQRRQQVIAGLMRFGLGIAIFCGAMLATGVLTGILPTWLYALYFETIPEHFHNPPEDAPRLLQRPLYFARTWMLVGGGVVALAIPFRGRLARVSAITALLYFPFLGFIHHHSHHYFLPLIAFCGVACCASIAADPKDSRRRLCSVLAVVLAAGLLFYATAHSL